ILGGPQAVRDRAPDWPVVDEPIIEAVVDALRQGRMSETTDMGHNLELERVFKEVHGVAHAMAVNGGTAALDSAVFAAGVGPGDEVITAPFCPGYVATPILHMNAIPVFIDVDPKTGCIDPAAIEPEITDATRAIMVVHLNGHPADMDPIMEVASRHGLTVIEDCAHSQGSTYKGRPTGALGHIAAFSLQSVKNLACGEGGMVLTDDPEMYERASLVGHHPARLNECLEMEQYRRYLDTGLGWNYRIHMLAAAIGVLQMERFDETMALRRANAERISHAMESIPGVGPTYVAPDCTHTYYAQTLTYHPEELDGLPMQRFFEALYAEGLDRLGAHGRPIHEFGIFQALEFYGKGCPWTCRHAASERSYKDLSFPAIDAMRASSFVVGLPAGYVTDDPAPIDQLIEAFRKVTSHAEEIRKT
ncbi:MAG TPA: DegT/DnrJ/EryC1/StrS family aminotransferase, partial [Armatimonadota bacterium]|nr:DegT/DnrJ/EryC1/StrS family aminotransferase [Armatimonadota bacterium]